MTGERASLEKTGLVRQKPLGERPLGPGYAVTEEP